MTDTTTSDIITGKCCGLCAQYFEKDGQDYEHGFPVVCHTCWDRLSITDKRIHERAEVETN